MFYSFNIKPFFAGLFCIISTAVSKVGMLRGPATGWWRKHTLNKLTVQYSISNHNNVYVGPFQSCTE